MTLEEFHSYTERQADWRTTPAMTADAAKADALRALLEYAEGGLSTRRGAPAPPVLRACGAFLVSDLLAHATDDEKRNLRAYSDAFAQTRQTIEVAIAPDLTKALAWGEAIVALEAAIPPASLRLTMQQKGDRTDLQNLIDGRGWRGGPGGNQVANFVDFVTRARPLMQATNGEEISAYLGLAATVNPADYVGQIQHVRNLHHFAGARAGQAQGQLDQRQHGQPPVHAGAALGDGPQRRVPSRPEHDRRDHQREQLHADGRGRPHARRDLRDAPRPRGALRRGRQDPAGDDRRARRQPLGGDGRRRGRPPRRDPLGGPRPGRQPPPDRGDVQHPADEHGQRAAGADPRQRVPHRFARAARAAAGGRARRRIGDPQPGAARAGDRRPPARHGRRQGLRRGHR